MNRKVLAITAAITIGLTGALAGVANASISGSHRAVVAPAGVKYTVQPSLSRTWASTPTVRPATLIRERSNTPMARFVTLNTLSK